MSVEDVGRVSAVMAKPLTRSSASVCWVLRAERSESRETEWPLRLKSGLEDERV